MNEDCQISESLQIQKIKKAAKYDQVIKSVLCFSKTDLSISTKQHNHKTLEKKQNIVRDEEV